MANSTTSVDIKLVSDFNHCITGDFDYIIIGSSFCALGFVEQLLQEKPTAKALIVEKGRYCSDIESLSPADLGAKEKDTEKISWTFKTEENDSIKGVRGLNYYVGGRSNFWKAWCPEPTKGEMIGWPKTVIDNLLQYFPRAKRLLSVKRVDEIQGEHFSRLQDVLFAQLESLRPQLKAIKRVEHASLALVEKSSEYGSHQKFSVLESLRAKIKMFDDLKLITECDVTEITMDQNSRASGLVTSKGTIPLGQAKLILAMSTLPSTILTLKSLPPPSRGPSASPSPPCHKHRYHSPSRSLSRSPSPPLPEVYADGKYSHPAARNIGRRFTAHFATYIFARVPCEGMFAEFARDPLPLELAALHIPGVKEKSGHQFHIQLNAVSIAGNEKPNLDKMRHLLKTPKEEMIETCHNHVVFVCATLGQVDHENPENKFYLDETGKPFLKFTANGTDRELWDFMDEVTFQVLEHLSPLNPIEYWDSDLQKWCSSRPPKVQIQHKYLVHPASTMSISDDGSSPVNLDYTVRGMDNVYMTGGALWPTAGSWNPTCAMTGLAMHLADCLTGHAPSRLSDCSNSKL